MSMVSAPMPAPPGGKLVCPAGTDPWVEVDNISGEINAECKPGPSPGDPRAYEAWVLSNLGPEYQPKTYSETQSFRRSLRQGTYTTLNKTFMFARIMDIGDEGSSGAMTAGE